MNLHQNLFTKNSSQIGSILTDSALSLLSCKHNISMLETPSFKSKIKYLIECAFLLKQNSDIEKILSCYCKIINPSSAITNHVLASLTEEKRKCAIHKLLKNMKHTNLQPAQLINYAVLAAHINDSGQAKKLIQKAYAQQATLKDGYAKTGWELFWHRKDYNKLIDYFMLDEKLGRLSLEWKMNLAIVYAASNKLKQLDVLFQNDLSQASQAIAHCQVATGFITAANFHMALKHFSLAGKKTIFPGHYSDSLLLVLLQTDNFSQAEKIAKKYKHPFLPGCALRHLAYINGQNEKPDYSKLMKLLEQDLALTAKTTFQTYIFLLIFAAYLNRRQRAHELLIQGSTHFPEKANLLWINYTASLYLSGNEKKIATEMKQVHIEQLVSDTEIALAAVWFAIAKMSDQANHCLTILYQHNPDFFISISTPTNGWLLWYSCLTHLAGLEQVSTLARSHAQQYYPGYTRYVKSLESIFTSPPSLTFPPFTPLTETILKFK